MKKPRPAEKAATHEPAVCPCCGMEFENRNPATETVYTCVHCGVEGFDCCIPGNNARCNECSE
jgi:queuine/archaeosine tRNA-ribosyltransferase